MRIGKLKKFEKKVEPEISAEAHAETLRAIADELAEIGRKMPPNNLPVLTTAQLVKEFNDIVAGRDNRVYIINRADGKRVEVCRGNIKIIDDDENKNASNLRTKNAPDLRTKFNNDELLILEQIQNG